MKGLLAVLAKQGFIADANVDEPTAIAQFTAKATELSNAKTTAENELSIVKTKLGTTETQLTEARQSAATAIVDAAIQAGRLPGQNEEVKAFWVASIAANPANAKALPQPNPALQTVVAKGGPSTAQGAAASGEHQFLVKAKARQAEKKISLEGAYDEIAHEDPKLYEDYRDSLGK